MKVKTVNNFKLIVDSVNKKYYIAKCLLDNTEIEIAIIKLPVGATIPSIITIEDHLQDYVTDFEEYKSFIQLVDEAYFRVENKKDGF